MATSHPFLSRVALVVTSALVVLPLHAGAAHAELPAPPEASWVACASADDAYCIESATRDGVDMLPGGDGHSIDDAPLDIYAQILGEHSVNFGV
jgi:hypothetical protein